ncbi:MAG: hypothetical protein R2784_15345 [Saprospiraceae bacterium]
MSEKIDLDKTNQKKFPQQWAVLKGENSWTMFKVLSELVEDLRP